MILRTRTERQNCFGGILFLRLNIIYFYTYIQKDYSNPTLSADHAFLGTSDTLPSRVHKWFGLPCSRPTVLFPSFS